MFLPKIRLLTSQYTRQCHHSIKLTDYQVIGLHNNIRLMANAVKEMTQEIKILNNKIDKLEKQLTPSRSESADYLKRKA